jgi:hypothetical protein
MIVIKDYLADLEETTFEEGINGIQYCSAVNELFSINHAEK